MHIETQKSLQELNTLAVPAIASNYVVVQDLRELTDAVRWAKQENKTIHVLAGGSNVVLAPTIQGLVLQPKFTGVEILTEDEEYVIIKAGAGENWHRFVEYCINNGLYGIENLALIPGDIGAAPIQNIGAYGVELDQVFVQLDAFNLEDLSVNTFAHQDCQFGYRDSIFKSKYRNRYVIFSVTLRLSKQARLNLTYPSLKQELDRRDIADPTPRDVMRAVIDIRQTKLPDPKVLPNAGSFFKNPVISGEQFRRLKKTHPALVSYPLENQDRKLAAAWLIEHTGWKGKPMHGVMMHPQHALVLTNAENCRSEAIYALVGEIKNSVMKAFGVALEVEPQKIG